MRRPRSRVLLGRAEDGAIALFVPFLIEPFGGLLAEWRQVIVFLSVASMILGAVAAASPSRTSSG